MVQMAGFHLAPSRKQSNYLFQSYEFSIIGFDFD